MKTMTIDELKKRGLKVGDIAYFTVTNQWGIVDGERSCEHMESFSGYMWLTPISMMSAVTKVIFKEDWINQDPVKIMKFFQGIKKYDSFPITKIVEKRLAKYVHAVHFGSSNVYTWRVPEKLNKVNFKAGDIVEVDTMYGNQYVQVKETAEYEYDEKTKEVLALVKATDLPF